jgi:hypothetical protein
MCNSRRALEKGVKRRRDRQWNLIIERQLGSKWMTTIGYSPFNAGGGARGNNHDIFDPSRNRRLGYSDVPHRFNATFLYELPFGSNKAIKVPTAVLREIVSGWQVAGTTATPQSPTTRSGRTTGSTST